MATTRITLRPSGEVQLVTGVLTHVTPSRRNGRAPLHEFHFADLSAIRKTSMEPLQVAATYLHAFEGAAEEHHKRSAAQHKVVKSRHCRWNCNGALK